MLTALASFQPPPPQWLNDALQQLQKSYPQDSYEGYMRFCVRNKDTGELLPFDICVECH